jgi:hypothetical protein
MNVCNRLFCFSNDTGHIAGPFYVIGIIQLWRRVTDCTLIDECTDDVLIDNPTVKNIGAICFERARSRKSIVISFSDEKRA